MSLFGAILRFFRGGSHGHARSVSTQRFPTAARYAPHDWPKIKDPGALLPSPRPPSPPPAPQPPEKPRDSGIRFQLAATGDDDPTVQGLTLDCDVRAFCNRLRQGVNEVYGGDAAAFYRAAGIGRSIYSRLISHPERHPSKATALAMAAALHLGLSDAEDFLQLAGYALSPAYPEDQTWRWCFIHGVYDIDRIKQLLKQSTT